MSQLYHDTLYCILEFVNIRDGVSILSVSRSWHELDRYEIVWKTLLSNWLKIKIHDYSNLKKNIGKSDEKYCEKTLTCLRKLYKQNIENEKQVKINFMGNDSNNDQSIMNNGEEYKKLVRSALYSVFRVNMMNGFGVLVMKNLGENILEFQHSNVFAQFHLDQAKKFILNKPINKQELTLEESEYWNRFSPSLLNFCVQRKQFDICKMLNNFRPTLNDRLLPKLLFQFDEREKLEAIKNYILNFKDQNGYNLTPQLSGIVMNFKVTNILGFEYLRECVEILYPGNWNQILENSVKSNRLELLSEKKIGNVEEFVEFCKIAELKKIELYMAPRFCNIFSHGFDFLHVLFKCELIDQFDMKLLLHKYQFREKEVMKFIEIMPDFDPYECVLDHRGIAHNFVNTFLTKPYGAMTHYFNNYFDKYPKFNLVQLIHKLNELDGGNRPDSYYDEYLNKFIASLFAEFEFNWFEAIDAITILGKFITHSLNIECLVKICEKYNDWNPEERTWNVGCFNAFQTLLENVHCINYNGEHIPFVEYCKTFYQNYQYSELDKDIYSKDTCWKVENRENLAKLYHTALNLIHKLSPQDQEDMVIYTKIRSIPRYRNFTTYETLYRDEDL
ncbi:hypothetical protein NAEGRDRAFT_46822 [Naegleria gruberi]|uniref:F-box domain-containing protein n=1 Tax=Naegleria gruberi TaxID=5762 RepID=D2V5A3_NAEGR|nr:uncharacterized protein NAEGRDRAFT_46822 [Naegleria gruberi]EFC48074.1 hypothetical protein NAEGRDRAFT_46822 [Naegleria gruberi]|eukprot:XP_002680818.1 hypothetical protein NAEGRDRAFT_46822 [Naegleria gruberi strain NEG-M]